MAFLQSALAFVVVVFTILHVLAARDDDRYGAGAYDAEPDR